MGDRAATCWAVREEALSLGSRATRAWTSDLARAKVVDSPVKFLTWATG